MDAGYGHGERSFFPANWEWTPNFVADKISLIKVTPPSDPAQKYGLSQLYRVSNQYRMSIPFSLSATKFPIQQDVSVFSGGFIAGNAKSIQRLHWLHRQKFIALLGRHKVDDDQVINLLHTPSLLLFYHSSIHSRLCWFCWRMRSRSFSTSHTGTGLTPSNSFDRSNHSDVHCHIKMFTYDEKK